MTNEETKFLDELKKSNDKMELNSKINNWTVRGSALFLSIVSLFILGFMINSSERMATMEATLVTAENITKLKNEIKDKFSLYVKLQTYFEIENNRVLTLIDYIDLIAFKAGIKEEELERARAGTIRTLNTYSGSSSIRSQKKATKERSAAL